MDLEAALDLVAQLDIYAHDAYILAAAQQQKSGILALDDGSSRAGGDCMKVYTYSEARQSLAFLLEQAKKEGAVRIRRRDGQTFVPKPEVPSGSPLDVEGIDLGVATF